MAADWIAVAGHEDVLAAYRLVLRRPPENQAVVDKHLAQTRTRAELFQNFIDSPEARGLDPAGADWPDLGAAIVDGVLLASREVAVGGRSVRVFGPPGDGYFQTLPIQVDGLGFFVAALGAVEPAARTVIDVGANIGLSTAAACAALPDAAVTAIEPGVRAFAGLKRTLSANGFARATASNLALGSQPGASLLVEDRANGSSAHILAGRTTSEGHPGAVRLSTLDEICAREGLAPDLIKIDVEGFELEVLAGGRRTLASHRPCLYVELNSFTCTAYGAANPRDLLKRLLDYGRSVVCVLHGEPRLLRTESEVTAFWHAHFVEHRGVDDLLCVPDGRGFSLARLERELSVARSARPASLAEHLGRVERLEEEVQDLQELGGA